MLAESDPAVSCELLTTFVDEIPDRSDAYIGRFVAGLSQSQLGFVNHRLLATDQSHLVGWLNHLHKNSSRPDHLSYPAAGRPETELLEPDSQSQPALAVSELLPKLIEMMASLSESDRIELFNNLSDDQLLTLGSILKSIPDSAG